MQYSKNIKRETKSGFTLIEILLVVAIIGILAALAAPRLVGRAKEARKSAARVDVQSIGTSLDLYELDNGNYPATLQGLITNPGKETWHGPYLKKGLMPKDPWGHAYLYHYPSAQSTAGYSLKSLGPDGVESGDDVSN